MKYFHNLPTINYSNNFVRNILVRPKMLDDFKKKTSFFYPYVLEEASASGLRYENLAFDYYNDVDDVWILHLTNSNVDPYYDVPLNQEQFFEYIKKKYGSRRNAETQIMGYRNNYYQDETILSIAGYNALATGQKKYWNPTVNFDNNIIGYERIHDETIVSTNKILTLEAGFSNTTIFNVGEKVIQDTSGASGFVTFANSSIFTVQHITGEFRITNFIVGQDSNANAVPSSVTTIVQNIPENEQVYFSAFSQYDYEEETNEKKKTIIVMDSQFKSVVYSAFNEIMDN